MKILNNEDLRNWSRVLQKKMKENGFNSSFSGASGLIKVYQTADKSLVSNPMTLQLFTRGELPEINLDFKKIETAEKLNPLKKEVMTLVIQWFKVLAKEQFQTEKMKVSVGMTEFGLSKPAAAEMEEWLASNGLFKIPNNGKREFFDVQTVELLKGLANLRDQLNEKRTEMLFSKVKITEDISVQISNMNSLSVRYDGVVERKATVTARLEEGDYRIEFVSPYHRKVVVLEALKFERYQIEWNIFVRECNLKGLIGEPEMTSSIKQNIHTLNRLMDVEKDKTEKETFNELLEIFTLEEMNELSKTGGASATEMKEFTFKDKHQQKDSYRTDLSGYCCAKVIAFYGKFVVSTKAIIYSDGTTKEYKKQTYEVLDTLFEAEKAARKWLINYI